MVRQNVRQNGPTKCPTKWFDKMVRQNVKQKGRPIGRQKMKEQQRPTNWPTSSTFCFVFVLFENTGEHNISSTFFVNIFVENHAHHCVGQLCRTCCRTILSDIFNWPNMFDHHCDPIGGTHCLLISFRIINKNK